MKMEQIVPKRPHIKFRLHMTYGCGTDCSETSAHKIQTPGEPPKRKNTTFTTQRKFEIKSYRLNSKVQCW